MRHNADTLGGVLLCTHDGEVLDGGLRPERAVADGDFAELDGRVWRLEEVLCDVRLQNRRFRREYGISIDTRCWCEARHARCTSRRSSRPSGTGVASRGSGTLAPGSRGSRPGWSTFNVQREWARGTQAVRSRKGRGLEGDVRSPCLSDPRPGLDGTDGVRVSSGCRECAWRKGRTVAR